MTSTSLELSNDVLGLNVNDCRHTEEDGLDETSSSWS